MRNRHAMKWLIVLALVVLIAAAQSADWIKLGTKTVRHSVDRDVILVGPKEGPFNAVKLKVRKAGLHIMDMKIHFMNGDVMDVEIRKFIPRDGETRVIDLPGKKRKIEKVVFWYKTPKKKAKAARIRLWARQ